jgi:cytochrome c oxidase cbb3-type subunit 3
MKQKTSPSDSQASDGGNTPARTLKPPKWCILTLGGCWVAGVSILAFNAISASDEPKTAQSDNTPAYLCGEEPTGIKTVPVFTISTKGNETASPVELGKTTYNTFCIACHQPGGTGKVGFAPAIRNPDFLALSSDDFIRTTIKKGRAGTAMTPWAMLNDQQIDGIIAYLRTTEGISLVRGKVDDSRTFHGNDKAGEPLYNTYCASCHGDKGIGYLSGSSGPGIGLKGFLDTASDDYIYQTMKYGRAGTPMRPMIGATGLANLNDDEAADIIAYLRNLNGGEKPASDTPKTKTVGDAKIGEQQYNMNCMACHQKDGVGKPGFAPSIRNRDFLAIASDDFIKTTISKGRLGTAMVPRPDISEENVNHLIAYLRSVPNPNPITIKVDNSLKIRGNATVGATKFTTYCATCHGEEGKGYITGVAGPAIGMAGFLDTASDDYIFQTVKLGRAGTAMKPFIGAVGIANLNKDDVADIISYLRSLNKK